MAETKGINQVNYIGGGVNPDLPKLQEIKDLDNPLFQEFDADGDGKVTPQEVKDGLIGAPIITIQDPTDIDTVLDGFEKPVEKPEKVKLDTDGDGKVSEDELVEYVKKVLAKKDDISDELDANGDGKISQAEIKRYNRNKAIQLLEDEVNMYDQLIKLQIKQPADIDGDGEISDAEQKAYNTGDYTEILDSNGDGYITEKELAEYNKMQAPKIIGADIGDISENPYLF